MTAMSELRESLREAARRDIARARRRRRRGRVVAVLALAVVGGGAAAEATDLFETGPAAPDIRDLGPRYAPAPGVRRQITAKVRVTGVPLPFGVAVYETAGGHVCAVAGVINGSVLGNLVDGRFRPFAADRIGTCNVPHRLTFDWTTIAGKAVLFGHAPTGTRTVTLPQVGQDFPVGKDGAFLFVFPERRNLRVDTRE